MFIGLVVLDWATIWVKVKLRKMVMPSGRCQSKGNGRDIIILFYFHLSDVDKKWCHKIAGWGLRVIAMHQYYND